MTSPLQQLRDHAASAQAAIQAQRESAAQIAADAQAASEAARQNTQTPPAPDGQGQASGS